MSFRRYFHGQIHSTVVVVNVASVEFLEFCVVDTWHGVRLCQLASSLAWYVVLVVAYGSICLFPHPKIAQNKKSWKILKKSWEFFQDLRILQELSGFGNRHDTW